MKNTIPLLGLAGTLAFLPSALTAAEWWFMDQYPWVYSSDDGWNWSSTTDGSSAYALSGSTSTELNDTTSGWWYADLYPWVWSADGGWNWIWTADGRLNLTSADGAITRIVPGITVNRDASPYVGAYQIENEDYGTMVTVMINGGVRSIQSNGLPNHEQTGLNSPNTASAQNFSYEFPTNPSRNASATDFNIPQPFGIAFNGVVIDPFAAEWFNDDRNSGWQLAALNNPLGFDINNAHVQPDGTYHYHGPPTAILTGSDDGAQLVGFAGDGFPIYGPYGHSDAADNSSAIKELTSSYQLKSGTRPDGPGGSYDGTYVEDFEYVAGSGDLDESNGRVGVTAEYPNGTYYYVITNQYPYIPTSFQGDIAESFVKAGGGGGPR